jgi:hypothetical protein
MPPNGPAQSNSTPIPPLSPLTRSRLEILASSNDAPSDSEIFHLKASLEEAKDRYHSLSQELAADNEGSLGDVQSQIEKYIRILSPLRRFPTEILSIIFEEYNDVQNSRMKICGFKVENGPWMLERVCRAWRTASINHSALWSSITFHRGSGKSHDFPLAGHVIQEGLRRTNMRPLDLDVVLEPASSERGALEWMNEGIAEKLFELIIPHGDRWESLSLSFMEDALPFLTAQTPVAVPMRSLQSLKLLWEGAGPELGGPGGRTRITLFADTPQLKELEVRNLQLPRDIDLHGQSIRTITARASDTDGLHFPVEILNSSPELRSFDVGDCGYVHLFPPSRMLPFCHQRLERLSLTTVNSLREFFRNIRLPSLLSLELEIWDTNWESTFVTDLNFFLTTSGCKLLFLRLDICDDLDSNLVEVFKLDGMEAVMSVEIWVDELTVEGDHTLVQLFELLTIIGSDTGVDDSNAPLASESPTAVYMPALIKLTIRETAYWSRHGCSEAKFIGPALFDMIASRRAHEGERCIPLKEISLRLSLTAINPTPLLNETHRRLRSEWVADGLKFDIRTGGKHTLFYF